MKWPGWIKSFTRKRKLVERRNLILRHIDTEKIGLEIGPSYSPILSKGKGYRVRVADHAGEKELRKKYANWNVDSALIEEVDYVITDSGLYGSIEKEGEFDFIIASHVIEHVPDPVTFLNDCERLLKPDGILSLAIPDKRYCFDALKPVSSTGQVLQANIERRKKHPPGTIFDAHAMHLARAGQITWPGNKKLGGCDFVHTVSDAAGIMREYIDQDVYMDVHAWQFTPESFAIILYDLITCGLIDLHPVDDPVSLNYEFFFSLKKSGEIDTGKYEPDRRLNAELAFKTE